MNYFHSLKPARLPKKADTDFLAIDGSQWSMGDLQNLRELTSAMAETVTELSKAGGGQEKAVKDVEGLLLKSEYDFCSNVGQFQLLTI